MTKRKEGFFQGVIYLMTSQIIIKILGMIYSLYLTNKRGFGDEGNAICMAGFQVYALLLGICAIGVPNSVSKLVSECAAIGDRDSCNKILKISLIVFSSIGFIFCFVLYHFSDFIANRILCIGASKDILKILAPSIVFSTMESVYRGYFNGMNKISISSKSIMVEQFLKTVFTLAIVEKIGSITNYNTELMAKGAMFAASIATISSFVYSFIKYKTTDFNVVSKRKENSNSIRSILRELFVILFPISLTTAIMIFQSNIDSITIIRILKNRIGELEARKVYGIITSKVNLIIGLPLALNGAVSISLIPEISRNMINHDYERLEKNINFSTFITLIISVPVMRLVFKYSKEIINFLFPNAPRGAELLKLASFTIVFSCITQNISGILQGIGNSKTHLYAVIIGMILKLILNVLLIPNKMFLERGAIISTVVANMFIFYIMYNELKKSFHIPFIIFSNFIKILILSCISIFLVPRIIQINCLNWCGIRTRFVIETLLFIIIFFSLVSFIIKRSIYKLQN